MNLTTGSSVSQYMKRNTNYRTRVTVIMASCSMISIACSNDLSRGRDHDQPTDIFAQAETAPVTGDADDLAIWANAADLDASMIVATEKHFGLRTYALDGALIGSYELPGVNNVDIRSGFIYEGKPSSLVVASHRPTVAFALYVVEPTTRELVRIDSGSLASDIRLYGVCMYHSRVTQDMYVIGTSTEGEIGQWRITHSAESGEIEIELVRHLKVDGTTEGCVADDEYGFFYVGEEDLGIWRFGAEPSAGSEGVLIDRVQSGTDFTGEVEGLTLYTASNGRGYLLASSQGNNTFLIYERDYAAKYVGSFRVNALAPVDGVEQTDGIDVFNMGLGQAFPNGIFVAQDGRNEDYTTNFKIVSWDLIAESHNLVIDVDYDGR